MTLDIDISDRITKNKKYLCGEDLADGMDRIVLIKDVLEQSVENPRNGSSSNEIVLIFEGDTKPMVLSAAKNFKNVAKATGSRRTKDWVGKKIQLYAEHGTFFGEPGIAVRVREFAPQ